MSDHTDPGQEPAPSRRAEAVWKASKERVAERNDQARKAAKEERKAHERRIQASRRDTELRERAELLRISKPGDLPNSRSIQLPPR
jgi:hypothetical protein